MKSPSEALRAGLSRPRGGARPASARPLVIVGAAGPLGGAVLEQALGRGAFGRVCALVTQPIGVALQGMDVLQVTTGWREPAMFPRPPDTAIVVFDREGSRHGREAAFLRPDPGQLPALGRWLRDAGVRRMIVVLPHAPALLPHALKLGLANLDEQALAALGFDQLVLVRPSRAGAAGTSTAPRGVLDRVALGVLSQLHWMVPQRDQPLRARQVGRFVVDLALALVAAAPGTRVAPPELLWDWAQPSGGDSVLLPWLAGEPTTPRVAPAQRW